MASHEFIKCQGTKLLTSLPTDVRHSLRHFEVAAVIRPFQPRPPLHGAVVPRQFCYAAVTDWSLLLLAMSAEGEAAILLKVPLLLIQDLDVESLDVADVVNDARGAVRSSCISIYPTQNAGLPASTTLQQQGQSTTAFNTVKQQSQAQDRPGTAFSPLNLLKQAFAAGASSAQPRKFRINRTALVRRPTPAETQQSEWHAAAAAVAPELQRHMTVGQQQEQQQRQLTLSIIQQLQVPVMTWQGQLNSRQQRTRPQQPGGVPTAARPMAEAIEHADHNRGDSNANGSHVGLPHGAGLPMPEPGVGVQVPSSKAPWSLINQGVAQSGSNQMNNSSMIRLKQRLTSDNVMIPPASTINAAEQAAGTSDLHTSSTSVNDRSSCRAARLKQRLTVDTAATLPAQQLDLPLDPMTAGSSTDAVLDIIQKIAPAGRMNECGRGSTNPHSQPEPGQPRAAMQVMQQPQRMHPQVPIPLQPAQQQSERLRPADTIDGSYCLQLITVERSSGLFFHIRKAWIGANMRAALSAAGAPGLPSWLPPPPPQQQQQPSTNSQQPAPAHQHAGSPTKGSKAWFQGFATPKSSLLNSPTTAAAVSSMSLTNSLSSAGSSSTFLSADSLAALQQDMMQFFGMMREPSLARKLSGPFPGDTPVWQQQQQQGSQVQLSSFHQPSPMIPINFAITAGGKANLWENDPLLDARMQALQAQQQQQQQAGVEAGSPSVALLSAFSPLASATSPDAWVADYSQQIARRAAAVAARRQSRVEVIQEYNAVHATAVAAAAGAAHAQQQLKARTALGLGPGQKPNKMLRAFMQVGAGVYAEPTASATREVFWHLADGLLKPCSLFDPGDVTVMKQLIMEVAFCRREQVGALQAAFFESSNIMSFLLARLTSWGVLMNLYPDNLPPIQNPAQPGRLDAYQGKPVVWITAMLYPGRPRQLMKKLGLTASGQVCFRKVLDTVQSLASKHQAAGQRAARAGSSARNSLRQGTLQSYYADPLNLSPVIDMPYLFVADARRMGRSSEASNEPELHHSSDDDEDSRSAATDLIDSGTLAESTNILRWERLAGRLAAKLASRKMQLLLFWLQMQLAYTEGCDARRNWVSEKALSLGAYSGSKYSNMPWTFRAATQQLLASLWTMNLLGTRPIHGTLIPGGIDDLLWWAQRGADSWVLDYVIGVTYELMGMCEQEACLQLANGQSAAADAAGIVMEVVKQVPATVLHQLLQQMFLRFACLMSGTAGNRDFTAVPADIGAVLAYKYGSVLLEVLGGVRGVADGLYDSFIVEVEHIMSVPQVQAQLAAAMAGCHASVLSGSNRALLEAVLAAVGAAVPWDRLPAQPAGLSVSSLGHAVSALKIQN